MPSGVAPVEHGQVAGGDPARVSGRGEHSAPGPGYAPAFRVRLGTCRSVKGGQMIIVMRALSTAEQLAAVLDRIRSLGLREQVSAGAERTVIGVIGDDRPVEPEVFEALPGVERVVRILHPFKLASR